MKKNVISEHIFLFPFTWKSGSEKNNYLFLQHLQIENKQFDRLKNWQADYATIEADKDYNEFVYFYKPVRASLYTFRSSPLIVRNYSYDGLSEDNHFIISAEGKEYSLNICNIHLKIYKTGIGILSLSVCNSSYESPQDIQNINSFSKCIYPPILPIEKAREELFPEYIKIRLNDKHKTEEYFNKDYHKEPITITPLIMSILGEPFVCKENKVRSDSLFIEPILGSQMFCLCLYKNPEIVEDMKDGSMNYSLIESFMMINKRIMYQQEDYIPGHVGSIYYLKSEHNIYGISRFSLMCISKEVLRSKLYDQLVSLVIMQRATLLSLSTEIARVSTLAKYDLVPAIESIYEIYIQFINQLYFKEVTEDIQGSLIYDKLSTQLKIEEELKQLDFEIDEVHEYATLIEQSQSKFKVQILTIIGAALVIPTFATGFFGMNIFKEEIVRWWMNKNVALWMNGYVFLPILIMVALCTWNRRKTKMNILKNIILLGLIFASIMIIATCGCGL
ncbi:hypothetical protein [Cellulosilyticum sp. I15G10I2]|uniref:hypothetical protein n=1 Tax=Cellulosilyticum sp. I15G10I2 TaxID=1892843 RepID=UPI00085C1BB2|nr:hypothetical protein [Cellulosilyticum sp. I15G10I2]